MPTIFIQTRKTFVPKTKAKYQQRSVQDVFCAHHNRAILTWFLERSTRVKRTYDFESITNRLYRLCACWATMQILRANRIPRSLSTEIPPFLQCSLCSDICEVWSPPAQAFKSTTKAFNACQFVHPTITIRNNAARSTFFEGSVSRLTGTSMQFHFV